MLDFPPPVPDFPDTTEALTRVVASGPRRRSRWPRRGFVAPPTRSPSGFLVWLLWQQFPILLVCCLTSMLEWLPGSLGPYLVGQIVDRGIAPRDLGVVWQLVAVMAALTLIGIGSGVLSHTFVVRSWLVGMYGTMKLVTRKATQLGHVLPQRTPTGEVLSVSAGDSDEFGALGEIVSRFLGALLAYLMIAGLVLSTSFRLGLMVLIAAPVVVLLVLPLLRPLQRREEVERARSSDLTSLATDIVAGLRILRGIGGEQTFSRNYAAQSQRTRAAGVSAGIWQGTVDSVSVLAAGMFLVTLTWLGAREVAAGELSVGELISFFGYAVFMVWPIQTFFELAQKWIRCLVSARRTITVLQQQPPWERARDVLPLPAYAPLTDHHSGLVVVPGELTVVVSALPDASAALADRLGRYLPVDTEPVPLDVDHKLKGSAARRARARQAAARAKVIEHQADLSHGPWGVSLGEVDLADAELADVRARILVADASSQVFAGTLQAAIDPHHRLSRQQAEAALWTAAGEDVFEAMPGGWQGVLDERGRGLSGGQRQRVVLARALGLDPQVLILVEPTSAVDAHTEAAIAERVLDFRRDRTTVVTTVSPLWLHHADRVALLDGGRITAYGRHAELLAARPDYRAVVARALDAPSGLGAQEVTTP